MNRMAPFAIKNGDTIYVVDPTQLRWFEYNDIHSDVTLFFHNGSMEVIKHRNARRIFEDLQLQFNVLDVRNY